MYSLSLISKQNQCTWVRSYLCTPLQQPSTQTTVTPLPQVLPSTNISQRNTTTSARTSTSDVAAQQAAAQLAQQQADAARLAQQQAAAQLAQQQAAASSVNTRTRAS